MEEYYAGKSKGKQNNQWVTLGSLCQHRAFLFYRVAQIVLEPDLTRAHLSAQMSF
jgi:hypothetical protein